MEGMQTCCALLTLCTTSAADRVTVGVGLMLPQVRAVAAVNKPAAKAAPALVSPEVAKDLYYDMVGCKGAGDREGLVGGEKAWQEGEGGMAVS